MRFSHRTLGKGCLQLELFYLQFELFCLQWESVCLRSTSTDCKQRSSTVSRKAPTVSQKASPGKMAIFKVDPLKMAIFPVSRGDDCTSHRVEKGCNLFCLQFEASCLQWSFFTYSCVWELFACSSSFLPLQFELCCLQLSFFAYSGKVCLTCTSTD